MKPWFVVVEGLDGSGKSTVAEFLAEEAKATLLRSPSGPFKAARSTVDTEARSPIARFFFYLAANFELAHHVQREIEAGRSVVCDRYLYSTLAFFAAQEVPIGDLVSGLAQHILMPDLAFFVACEPAIRIARMTGRGQLTTNDRTVLRIGERYATEYEKLGLVTVDNSTDDPWIAVRAMLARIHSLK